MHNGWIGLVTLLVILSRKRHLEVMLVKHKIQIDPKKDPKLVFCVYSNYDWRKIEN